MLIFSVAGFGNSSKASQRDLWTCAHQCVVIRDLGRSCIDAVCPPVFQGLMRVCAAPFLSGVHRSKKTNVVFAGTAALVQSKLQYWWCSRSCSLGHCCCSF